MNLFYSNNIVNDMILLSEGESHHCMHVLRNNVNDSITILDGVGGKHTCEIISFNKKEVRAQIIETITTPKKTNHPHLIISPTKSQDRVEWLVEKSIEIGVDRISFVSTKRTERNRINMTRINKIAISAMKQSKQYYLPCIDEITPLTSMLKNIEKKQRFIAHLNDDSTIHLAKLYDDQSESCILIGPEGDFTQEEVDFASQLKFTPISLGDSTLRTETAGIYALSIINTLNESRA